MVEEGQPTCIEQNLRSILHHNEIDAKLHGKDMLPMAGEYTALALLKGILKFIRQYAPALLDEQHLHDAVAPATVKPVVVESLASQVAARPPSFCTGCPERPIFTAMKLVERELG